MEEIESLDVFKMRMKELLEENEDTHQARFQAFEQWLQEITSPDLNKLNQNEGFRKLMTEFHHLIKEASKNKRGSVFKEFTQEVSSHLLKRSKQLLLTESELKKRKDRIKKIKKMMVQNEKKISRYESKELSLDDLENCENGPVEKARRCKARVIKLYTELRTLENRLQYFGEDEISFKDVSREEELNGLLADHVLKKFNKKRDEPDFVEVNEIVQKYASERGVLLDSVAIFRNINDKFKKFRSQTVEFVLDAYLGDQTDPSEEDEELKRKLDAQNHFKDQLEKVKADFVAKAQNAALQEPDESDEESEDSESDSVCEDENGLDSISEQEDEFLSPEERDSSDEDADDQPESEEEENASEESKQPNGETALKRTPAEAEVSEETEGVKKIKFSEPEIITLD